MSEFVGTTDAVLYYWPIKARSYAALAIANAGGIHVSVKSDFDLGDSDFKGKLPFGQCPYLEHGDIKLAQSGAIIRYMAKLGNLSGDSIAKFAKSEMLIEESQDIFTILAKAQYAGDKAAAYNDTFATDGPIKKQLNFLEKLIPDGKFSFTAVCECGNPCPCGTDCTCGHTRLAGEYAIAAIIDMVVQLEGSALDDTPKLKAFYDDMMASSAFAGIKDMPMYFSRT